MQMAMVDDGDHQQSQAQLPSAIERNLHVATIGRMAVKKPSGVFRPGANRCKNPLIGPSRLGFFTSFLHAARWF